MTRILVTGASGNIGRMTLKNLLKRVSAEDIVGLARDPDKAADLAAEGIEIRKGDYFDYEGLVRAFDGIDKVMLVSTHAFTDRNTQHENAINAAKQAGVKHIVYMPIIHKADSTIKLPQVTDEDIFVEKKLKTSGLTYTLVRHPPFLENIQGYVGGDPLEKGVIAPVGAGKAGYACRAELAEAHAVVLTEAGHENKSYSLYGGPAVSFSDIALILSDIGGRPVPFKTVSDQEYIANLVSAGMPEPAAEFVLNWVHGVNAGEWEGKSGDLENLLGRKPMTPSEFLRTSYAARQHEIET